MENKKAVSPMIATIILVAIVVVLAMIVFLWVRGMTKEAVIKDGQAIELSCENVNFQASYSGGSLSISNTGNVPILNFQIKTSGGERVSSELSTFGEANWPENGLNPGGAFSGSISLSGDEVELKPILLGTTSSGEKRSHTCEGSASKRVSLN